MHANEFKLSLEAQIIDSCKKLYDRNLLAGADGNVSFRRSDDEIWVTPRGRRKSELDEEELAMGISKELANVKEMQEYLGFEWSRTALLGKGLLFKNDPNFYYQQLEKMVQLSTQEVEKVIQEYLRKKYVEVQFNSAPK